MSKYQHKLHNNFRYTYPSVGKLEHPLGHSDAVHCHFHVDVTTKLAKS